MHLTSLPCDGTKCRWRAGSDYRQKKQTHSQYADDLYGFWLLQSIQLEKPTTVFIKCRRLLFTKGGEGLGIALHPLFVVRKSGVG